MASKEQFGFVPDPVPTLPAEEFGFVPDVGSEPTPIKLLSPEEMEDEAKSVFNFATDLELPINAVERNVDLIKGWKPPADPTDLPQDYVPAKKETGDVFVPTTIGGQELTVDIPPYMQVAKKPPEWETAPTIVPGVERGFWKNLITAGYQGGLRNDRYWEMNAFQRKAFDTYMAGRHVLTRIGAAGARALGVKGTQELYDDELVNNQRWYSKGPELIGWGAVQAAEFYALSAVFEVTGLGAALNKAGQSLAKPFIAKEITRAGGGAAINTMSRIGLKQIGNEAMVAFLKHAPSNVAFLSAWSTGDAALQGRDKSEAAVNGALWGLGFSALPPAIGAAFKTQAGQRVRLAMNEAYTNLWINHPRIMNAGRKGFSDEFMAEAQRQFKSRFGVNPTAKDVAQMKKFTRDVAKEITRQAEKKAAVAAYWQSGKVAAEPAPPTAPTELAKPVTTPPARPAAAPVAKPPAEGVVVAPEPPTAEKGVEVTQIGQVEAQLKDREGKTELFRNKKGDILVTEETNTGLSRAIIDTEANIDPIGSGHVDTKIWSPVKPEDVGIAPDAIEVPIVPTAKQLGKTAAFEAYKTALPNATEKEIVAAMVEDGIEPPLKILEANKDVAGVKGILADRDIERVAKLAVKKPVEVEPSATAPLPPPQPPRADVTKPIAEPKPIKPIKPPEFDFKPKGKPGKVDLTPIVETLEAVRNVLEPGKAVDLKFGKEVSAEVIKATHAADVARIEFDEQRIAHMDTTLGEFGKALAKYPKNVLENLMLSRGKTSSPEANAIQQEALVNLKNEAPELVGTRRMIQRIADFNFKRLEQLAGENPNYVDDYFYGTYKPTRKVKNFWEDTWQTTDKFLKQKKIFTAADAKAAGLELRHSNPVDNLRAEYQAIARLDAMRGLKAELLANGTGQYIELKENAPIHFDRVKDPVFADVRLEPDLAHMINTMISTNKITRQRGLNFLRQTNNFLRTIKFMGSAFHLGVIAKQAVADSGFLGFLFKPTALRGFTTGFKTSDPIFKTPEYKDYIKHGGGHRFSVDVEAQRAFSDIVGKMNESSQKIIKGAALPIRIPEAFVRWMFENYIPKVKYSKYLDFKLEQESKLGRELTSAEKIDIIKEQQNFYGEMNERLFGRSGTVTTAMRFLFMAPGFAEGNVRTMLKATLQWGQALPPGPGVPTLTPGEPDAIPPGEPGELPPRDRRVFNASRSRSNIINSFIITAAAATVSTMIMTGKPPKKPETAKDVRDLFKIDTGRVDASDKKIMIDLMSYDKDYWNVFGNIATGQPGRAVKDTWKRMGGMGATTASVIADMHQMSMGNAIYDWKENRVVEITDPFLQKVFKLAVHELAKAEPISMSVYEQARDKDLSVVLSAATALAGVRLTKTEEDKRDQEALSTMFSLRDQKEQLQFYLGTIDDPRDKIAKYNHTVNRILNSTIVSEEIKEEFEDKLIINEERLIANRVFRFEQNKAKLVEATDRKEIKEIQDEIKKDDRWLTNFEVTQKDFKKHLVDRERFTRKLIKEIDDPALATRVATFYAEKGILTRKKTDGTVTDAENHDLAKFNKLALAVGEVAALVSDPKHARNKARNLEKIERIIDRAD